MTLPIADDMIACPNITKPTYLYTAIARLTDTSSQILYPCIGFLTGV